MATRQEKIEAILTNMACGNNDTALSQHVRRNLEKATDRQIEDSYNLFVSDNDAE